MSAPAYILTQKPFNKNKMSAVNRLMIRPAIGLTEKAMFHFTW